MVTIACALWKSRALSTAKQRLAVVFDER